MRTSVLHRLYRCGASPDDIHLSVSNDYHPNYLNSVESRQEPVEVGHRTATICHTGNVAMRLKRKLQWDPEQERFVNNNDQASQNAAPPYREPWKI